MQTNNTFTYRDSSEGGNNTFLGSSINIILPPKPGYEGANYSNNGSNNQGESKMDVCALTLSCLAQDPNLPSSKLPFAWKLYEMLETVHKNKGDTEIVSWVDGGEAFKVHDLKRFVDEIVPIYFKQSKYKSFQRQLYFYGFIRENSSGKQGHTPGSYRHPRFVRGQKTWCLSMAPKKSKKRGSSKSPVMGSSPKKVSTEQQRPTVVREVSVSSEITGDSSQPSNDFTPLPLHVSSHMHSAFRTANVVSQDADSNNYARNVNPQMQFRQQQNQLKRLQIEGFLKSLQQNNEKKLPQPNHEPSAPPAPSLQHATSDGHECNIFGGTFHYVAKKR
mmetsp:Transcript_19979/g.49713  ORF Transcript_19979/g.49713 Transcript_19979/m.49713 type:complete len:332 (+) Transcript_19979:60-1055(+)